MFSFFCIVFALHYNGVLLDKNFVRSTSPWMNLNRSQSVWVAVLLFIATLSLDLGLAIALSETGESMPESKLAYLLGLGFVVMMAGLAAMQLCRQFVINNERRRGDLSAASRNRVPGGSAPPNTDA